MNDVYFLTNKTALVEQFRESLLVNHSQKRSRRVYPMNGYVSQVRYFNEIPQFHYCLVIVDDDYFYINPQEFTLPPKWTMVIALTRIGTRTHDETERIRFMEPNVVATNGFWIYKQYKLEQNLKQSGLL